MDIDRRAIPTMYRGTQYRSRLEAKWAAFFDLLEWPYEYEPFDLNGWIPDFILKTAIPVLVEVKSVLEFPQDVADRIDRIYPPDEYEGCDDNQWHQREVLIVGCSLITSDELWDDQPCVGWLREGGWWEPAVFGRWDGSEGKGSTAWHGRYPIGFCHVMQSYVDRVTKRYDGGCHGGMIFRSDEVRGLWKRAGNATQWHGIRAEG
jgi:hypothetical protein